MGTEIAINKPGQIVAQPAQSLDQFIIQACNTEGFDVDKLERLVALQERREEQHRKELFFDALKACQAAMPRVQKNGLIDPNGAKIPYAKLEDVDACIRRVYEKFGFSVTFDAPMTTDGGKVRTVARFSCAGHTEPTEITAAADTRDTGRLKMSPVQMVRKTVTESRRNLLEMFFNVITVGAEEMPQDEPITQDQADDIRTRMNELPQSKPGIFLDKLCRKYGVGRPEELRVSQLDNALADVAATVDRSAK